MDMQSQRREGAVKKGKNWGTRLVTKDSRTQHAIDAGRVAFIAIENCEIGEASKLERIQNKNSKASSPQGMF